jgi:ribosome-interacting GTPase 1
MLKEVDKKNESTFYEKADSFHIKHSKLILSELRREINRPVTKGVYYNEGKR